MNSAELIIYSKDGEQVAIDLSPTQLAGIIKLLGLSYDKKNHSYSMFSDESLQKFMDKTINKWQQN